MNREYLEIEPSRWLVDMRYQREADAAAVNRIASNFSEKLFGVPVLSRRDGKLYAVDGNHRRMALIKMGDDCPRMCLVLSGLGVQDEAKLFHDLQKNRRGHHAYGQFKARVTMCDPVALDIVSILRRHDLRIGTNKSPTTISAVRAVECAYRLGTLDVTIGLLSAWADEAALDGGPIRYLARFVQVYGSSIDSDRILKALRRTTVDGLIRLVKIEAKDWGCSTDRAAVSTIRTLCNINCPRSKRLPRADENDK